ncbi:MAG TPA: hypothetical protein VFW84_06340 [Aquabacterium sp.]|uniref:hypothetical protein n=1 Tax=Aquabacterium sp. TaxID=1872578 RepID=UPI002E366677|nr:hypothetical protein [Aquabacterium sp.]HEX5372336.1 hypothetical protein [Aquabacterium sp.]
MRTHLTLALTALTAALVSLTGSPVHAHGNRHPAGHHGGIQVAATKQADKPAFDIIHTQVRTEGNTAIFHMAVSGKAGVTRPTRSGKLAGSQVFSYVWPTSMDPAVVGFEAKSGILALAVTSHPDFDDTPLFDENGDGQAANDGQVWHSHWVVLQADEACGKGALKVVDIPEGSKPRLPKTWPGLPILIDSPGWSPLISRDTVEVRVPFDDITVLQAARFDGVTAALRVNASVHNPLLCVVNVFKVASGDLSLPGKVLP